MSAWQETTLGEVCDAVHGLIQTGPFGSQLHQSDYSEHGVPVVMPKDIIEGRISSETVARVSGDHVERLSRHKLSSGDIVYGRRGDIGRQALIRSEQEGWMCGTGCLRISLGESILNPLFLHYYLSQDEVVGWITNQAVGATMPNLNTGILRSVPVRYPSLPIQRRIAGILSAYDDLIENSQRRIKILEEMARRLYREWFVHFRFPGHEDCLLVESPLGEIPEGWEVKAFTEIADVLSGGTPKTDVPQYWNGEIPFFTPRDAPDCFYLQDTDKHVSDIGLTKCASALYPPDTVFITARGTVGKVALPAVNMAMNQSCYALRGKTGIPQRFLFLMTLQQVDYLKTNTGGATFDTIVVDTFRRMEVVSPSQAIASQFSELIDPVFEQVNTLQRQIQNLRRTRDLLLPRLLSGQIDVEALPEPVLYEL
jgi:type I restriction enzyme S subunit